MVRCGLDGPTFSARCFRSSHAVALYNATFASPTQAVKVAGMVLISIALLARSARLFVRLNLSTALAAAALFAVAHRFGAARTAVAVAVVGTAILSVLLHGMPTDNAGHRAGGHGYGGPGPQENTLEALQALIAADNDAGTGPLPKLAYVEWDVHETKDGELVVFHDDTLARAVRRADGTINAKPAAALRAAGLDWHTALIQQMTAAQLRSFHLGGVNGSRIPTLDEYLSCCCDMELRRSIAVEVKKVSTDRGRQKLLDAMREYASKRRERLESQHLRLLYPRFGVAAVIAFPWTWAESFGEFGSSIWQRWALGFRDAGIPVKSCIFHWLLLTYGA